MSRNVTLNYYAQVNKFRIKIVIAIPTNSRWYNSEIYLARLIVTS